MMIMYMPFRSAHIIYTILDIETDRVLPGRSSVNRLRPDARGHAIVVWRRHTGQGKAMKDPEKKRGGMLAGSCLCGAVRYTVADAFRYAVNCHCSNCRRTTGAAFKPIAGIERDRLRVITGEDQLMIFGEVTGHDAHCKLCGSLLYSVVRDGAYVHVAMGTLVDDPSIRPTHHIFVGSKAPWFTITDDLPQYTEHAIAARPAGA